MPDNAFTQRTVSQTKSLLPGKVERISSWQLRGIVGVFAIVIPILGWNTMQGIELRVRERTLSYASAALATTHRALYLWLRQHQATIESLAATPEVQVAATSLAAVSQDPDALRTSSDLAKLRTVFAGLIEQPVALGFRLIATDRITIASSEPESLGTRTFLAVARAPVLDRVFAGETLIVPPLHSDIAPNAPTMFIAAPVRNAANTVVAVLAIRLDPKEFSSITELGQVLQSGKTYAFDSDGVLLTENRANGQSTMLAVQVRDPGGNLLQGYVPALPAKDRPLTVMAQAAIARGSGSNIAGYRDYRGVDVMGAWTWDNQLNVGLATEVDSDDAMTPYYDSRVSVFRILAVTLFVALLGFRAYVQVVRGRRAVEAAEEASRMKSRFLANMSHEIRTPMNGVIGLTELVLSSDLRPDLRDTMETIRSSADSLMGILNDILDTSKLDSGQFELEAVPFDLHAVLLSIMRVANRAAIARRNELALDIAPDVAQIVIGDSLRVRQILTNLVGNATKFTENGEIEVVVRRHVENGDPSWVRFSVRDTGIGIPKDKLGQIFEEFSQADASVTRRYGGTGLGLTISHRLVELMAGRMDVQSVVGDGSTFSFTIPLPAGGNVPPQLPPARLDGRTALVVDDNATNRRIARAIVEQAGMTVVEASGVDEAVRQLREGYQDRPFDVALIDIQMPGKSGFDLLTAVRDLPAVVTACMVLTSSGGHGDAERARALGARAFMTKPVSRQELLERIAEVLSGMEPSEKESAPAPTPKPGRAMHVLLAEDNAVNQRVAVATLKRLGHTVEVVEDGRAAVEAVQRTAFDLVLMDIEMPQLDGYAACERIRQIPRLKALPIIGLTAHAMVEAREKAMAAGMNGFITKPFKIADMMASLESINPSTTAR